MADLTRERLATLKRWADRCEAAGQWLEGWQEDDDPGYDEIAALLAMAEAHAAGLRKPASDAVRLSDGALSRLAADYADTHELAKVKDAFAAGYLEGISAQTGEPASDKREALPSALPRKVEVYIHGTGEAPFITAVQGALTTEALEQIERYLPEAFADVEHSDGTRTSARGTYLCNAAYEPGDDSVGLPGGWYVDGYDRIADVPTDAQAGEGPTP